MFRRSRRCLAVALFLGLSVPVHEAHAQMQWSRTSSFGYATGGVASIPVINREGSSSSISDGAIFASFVFGGAVLGGLLQSALEPRLRPSPAVGGGLGFSPSRGATPGVRYSF